MLLSFKSRLSGSFQLPLLLMVLFVCAPAAFGQAQSNAADIQGTVKDATGAVVANATVTARNPGTNFSRTATSNDEGFYRIINVPPGGSSIGAKALRAWKLRCRKNPNTFPCNSFVPDFVTTLTTPPAERPNSGANEFVTT